MRTFLTLDYEVFFGRNTGSVARTMVEPTDALLSVANLYGARLVFFVDAGFILRLRAEKHKSITLQNEYDALCRQVESLARAGHEVQLHIHSHWEDSHWNGEEWSINLNRYALQAFETASIAEIVQRYVDVLRDLAGPEHAFAYRAGGWLIQPFEPLHDALLASSVCIDSTVYSGGTADSETHRFDFQGSPDKSRWRFEHDPLQEVADGRFLEVPIASFRLSPAFFWRLAVARKLGGAMHRPFGDGKAIAMGRDDMVKKLTQSSVSVVSMDGYKASYLKAAARHYRARGLQDFVVIGHPKALTPYSLTRLSNFLASDCTDEVCTFGVYRSELNQVCAPATIRN